MPVRSVFNPFSEEHDLVGLISAGDSAPVKVHFRIRQDPTNRTPVTAVVYGTQTTAHNLLALIHRARPYVTLQTDVREAGILNVFSDKAVFHGPKTTYRRGIEPEIIRDEIGTLEFYGITFLIKWDAKKNQEDRERVIVFFLQGPSSAWAVSGIKIGSYAGSVKARFFNTELRVGRRYPFTIHVGPYFFHAHDRNDPQGLSFAAETYAISFKTRVSTSDLSDQKFLEQALSITDDLTDIVSFLSKELVTWYAYSFSKTREHRIEIRRVAYKEPGTVNFNELVVDPSELRRFLRAAFCGLSRLRKRGIDPVLAMRLYVSSFDQQFVEEKVISSFRSLEHLVGVVRAKSKPDALMPKQKFDKLRKAIKKVIEHGASARVSCCMNEKLSELNRPAFLRMLKEVCDSLQVSPVAGLYPDGHQLTFIDTRNKLVHGSPLTDTEFMVKETARTRAVVERLILRLLGWDDLSYSPPPYVSQWLAK